MNKLLLMFLFISNTFAKSPFKFNCENSHQSVFKNENVLKLSIVSNFDQLNDVNTSKKDSIAMAMSYLDSDLEMSGLISGRLQKKGITRSRECNWTPFRIRFDDRNNTSRQSELSGIGKLSDERVFQYYEKTSKLDGSNLASLNKSLFKNLGKSLRVVPHCELGTYPMKNFKEERDVDKKVLYEYIVYKFFETLELPIKKARLAFIKYFDERGELLSEHYGFFREGSKDVAKRCTGLTFHDEVIRGESSGVMSFLNFFVGNRDFKPGFHNSKNYEYENKSLFGDKYFFAPYDFDSSTLVFENRKGEYVSNKYSIDAKTFSRRLFRKILPSLNKKELKQVTYLSKKILSERNRFLKILNSTPLTEVERSDISNWFKPRFKILNDFIEDL